MNTNTTEFDIVYCRSCGSDNFCDCDEQEQDPYQEECTYSVNFNCEQQSEYDGCEG